MIASSLFCANRTRIVELAAEHRLSESVVVSGDLMAYGPDCRGFRDVSGQDPLVSGTDLNRPQPT